MEVIKKSATVYATSDGRCFIALSENEVVWISFHTTDLNCVKDFLNAVLEQQCNSLYMHKDERDTDEFRDSITRAGFVDEGDKFILKF